MRLLHVISTVNSKSGGPINGVNALFVPMSKLGVDIDVVCCDDPKAQWLDSLELPRVYALGPSIGTYGYNPRLIPWLMANKEKYDAVVVNGLWQFTGFAVNRVFSKTSIPYFVFSHGMLDPWFKKRYPLKHLKKWLYWPWGEYRVLRDARRVIFTCEEERLLARQSFWLYKVREAVTAYGAKTPAIPQNNPVELFNAEFPECRGKRILLFLSRIHEKKGCDILIEGFSKFAKKDYHLVIAGPDQNNLIPGLKQLANTLGVGSAITWTGMLEGDMKAGAYMSAELFCLPSHQENFGIVVAEALAYGLPVFISNKVNIWREIESSNSGLIDEDTATGVVRAMEKWDVMTISQKQSMSFAAKKSFQEKFEIGSAAKTLLNILKS